MLNIDQCRSILGYSMEVPDEIIEGIRHSLYLLADVLIEQARNISQVLEEELEEEK